MKSISYEIYPEHSMLPSALCLKGQLSREITWSKPFLTWERAISQFYHLYPLCQALHSRAKRKKKKKEDKTFFWNHSPVTQVQEYNKRIETNKQKWRFNHKIIKHFLYLISLSAILSKNSKIAKVNYSWECCKTDSFLRVSRET